MNAERHRRAAALVIPPAAPGDIVIGLRAIPEGVADQHHRPAQPTALDQVADVLGRRTEAPLKHIAEVTACALFHLAQGVELGQRQADRFFGEDPGPRFQTFGNQGQVGSRWGREVDDVGLLSRQHFAGIGVPARDPGLLADRFDPRFVDVHRGQQLNAIFLGFQGCQMRVDDRARADDDCSMFCRQWLYPLYLRRAFAPA